MGNLHFLIIIPFLTVPIGILFWWFFVVRPGRATVFRGLFVGVLVALAPEILIGGVILGPFGALMGVYLVGWATVPVGAIGGVLLVYLQRAVTHHWMTRAGQLHDVAFYQRRAQAGLPPDDTPYRKRIDEHTEENDRLASRIFWLQLALSFALISEITALVFLQVSKLTDGHGNFPLYLEICAPLASALIGVFMWRRTVASSGRATIWRGICIGALSNTIIYPFATLFVQPYSPDFGGMLLVFWTGLISTGWAIAPIGGLAGALFAYLQPDEMHFNEQHRSLWKQQGKHEEG